MSERFTEWFVKKLGPPLQKTCGRCGCIVNYGCFNPNAEHTCNSAQAEQLHITMINVKLLISL